MLSIDTIFLFLFIFSTLIILKNALKFTGTLLGKDNFFSGRDLFYLGLSLSYFLTYIFRV
jgi:hypothetical protein